LARAFSVVNIHLMRAREELRCRSHAAISDESFAEHTNVYATGADGAVWSTFWLTKDESRTFRPNTPFWRPGEENASYSGGIGLGPGGLRVGLRTLLARDAASTLSRSVSQKASIFEQKGAILTCWMTNSRLTKPRSSTRINLDFCRGKRNALAWVRWLRDVAEKSLSTQ
jgi:hypothetical protein